MLHGSVACRATYGRPDCVALIPRKAPELAQAPIADRRRSPSRQKPTAGEPGPNSQAILPPITSAPPAIRHCDELVCSAGLLTQVQRSRLDAIRAALATRAVVSALPRPLGYTDVDDGRRTGPRAPTAPQPPLVNRYVLPQPSALATSKRHCDEWICGADLFEQRPMTTFATGLGVPPTVKTRVRTPQSWLPGGTAMLRNICVCHVPGVTA